MVDAPTFRLVNIFNQFVNAPCTSRTLTSYCDANWGGCLTLDKSLISLRTKLKGAFYLLYANHLLKYNIKPWLLCQLSMHAIIISFISWLHHRASMQYIDHIFNFPKDLFRDCEGRFHLAAAGFSVGVGCFSSTWFASFVCNEANGEHNSGYFFFISATYPLLA